MGTRHSAALAGITRQLLGRPTAPFAYRGTLAPWPVAPRTSQTIAAIGRSIARRFGLVGLFGVDLVVDRNDEPWLVEVNPRYTASVEVVELMLGRALLSDHARACEGRPIDAFDPLPERGRFIAKEVVFAEGPGTFREQVAPLEGRAGDVFRVPRLADIPHPGTPFKAGEPVLTIFAEASTAEDALYELAILRNEWRRRLARESGS